MHQLWCWVESSNGWHSPAVAVASCLLSLSVCLSLKFYVVFYVFECLCVSLCVSPVYVFVSIVQPASLGSASVSRFEPCPGLILYNSDKLTLEISAWFALRRTPIGQTCTVLAKCLHSVECWCWRFVLLLFFYLFCLCFCFCLFVFFFFFFLKYNALYKENCNWNFIEFIFSKVLW